MQAALCNVAPPHTAFSRALFPAPMTTLAAVPSRARSFAVRAASRNFQTVNYSSPISVFPAEACETIGGESCLADIYPEVRIEPGTTRAGAAAIKLEESVEREYLEYTTAKTVFPAEACDDLGGEFCERPYQRGVY